MDVGGNWEVNMVLIEETLNLLPRLRNALSQGSRSLEYLICAEQSSCHFHVSLQISWFLFLNYFKTLDTSPSQKEEFFYSQLDPKQLPVLFPPHPDSPSPLSCFGLYLWSIFPAEAKHTYQICLRDLMCKHNMQNLKERKDIIIQVISANSAGKAE